MPSDFISVIFCFYELIYFLFFNACFPLSSSLTFIHLNLFSIKFVNYFTQSVLVYFEFLSFSPPLSIPIHSNWTSTSTVYWHTLPKYHYQEWKILVQFLQFTDLRRSICFKWLTNINNFLPWFLAARNSRRTSHIGKLTHWLGFLQFWLRILEDFSNEGVGMIFHLLQNGFRVKGSRMNGETVWGLHS